MKNFHSYLTIGLIQLFISVYYRPPWPFQNNRDNKKFVWQLGRYQWPFISCKLLCYPLDLNLPDTFSGSCTWGPSRRRWRVRSRRRLSKRFRHGWRVGTWGCHREEAPNGRSGNSSAKGRSESICNQRVVKWSASSPSTPTIQVRILLKPTVFSAKFVFEKNENKQKEAEVGPVKKFLQSVIPGTKTTKLVLTLHNCCVKLV